MLSHVADVGKSVTVGFPVLGLWITAIIHCVLVASGVPWFWVAAELFWPQQGQEKLCVVWWT